MSAKPGTLLLVIEKFIFPCGIIKIEPKTICKVIKDDPLKQSYLVKFHETDTRMQTAYIPYDKLGEIFPFEMDLAQDIYKNCSRYEYPML